MISSRAGEGSRICMRWTGDPGHSSAVPGCPQREQQQQKSLFIPNRWLAEPSANGAQGA